jgi:DNA repair photolyase
MVPPRRLSNPPNPWESTCLEWLEEPPAAALEVYEEAARSILAENRSPDLGFRFSLNPYRGCWHACAYCYARPSHQWLGFGAGTDFERRIVVKRNAPELLRRALARSSWRRELVVFSGDTDCYQPLEASYRLTRACLEICGEHSTPIGVITKSALVRRDVDVLAGLARRGLATVHLSIPFADAELARRIEPFAPPPARRFETLRILSEAGIPTGVSVSPLIPALNDAQVPEILERARRAGARFAFSTLLRLPGEVRQVFEERLREALPLRAEHVFSALREVRGGRVSESAFFERQRGRGPRWEILRDLFELHRRRLGFEDSGSRREGPGPATTPRPSPSPREPAAGTRQLALFEGPGARSSGSQ